MGLQCDHSIMGECQCTAPGTPLRTVGMHDNSGGRIVQGPVGLNFLRPSGQRRELEQPIGQWKQRETH